MTEEKAVYETKAVPSIEIYNKAPQPPVGALKEITGGRLSGKTDISPQWRYRAMTEIYGLCGFGWKYEIIKQWVEEGSEAQKMCFTNIDLYVKIDDQWSEAIPGTGGSMIVESEKAGLHTSDEGFKMALTDALSVAMTRIGIASAIYMGQWDGSKYNIPQQSKPGQVTKAQKENLHIKMTTANVKDQKGFYNYTLAGKEPTKEWATKYIENFEKCLFEYRMSLIQKAYPDKYIEALEILGYENAEQVNSKDYEEVLRGILKIKKATQ